jgi:5-formyltetrahydrofolate cyclo-ligase
MGGRLPGAQNAPVANAQGRAAADKAAMRAAVMAARRALPATQREQAARGLAARVLSLPEAASAGTVAAYVSVGTEPGTGPLLRALHARGTRVLLPVLRADLDLDWAPYTGERDLVSTGRGLREPAATRLGRDAVTGADLVVVPALAVDNSGRRLGRGGGSYDRVLARLTPGTAVAALLHDGEVLTAVPAEGHDRTVTVAVTPSAVLRVG